MPYLVNGQPVAEELILEELVRLGRDFQWQAIPDPTERDHRLRRIKAREKVELTGLRLVLPSVWGSRIGLTTP
jgi:hypothetical protein